jgi:hypothetical protein
MRTGTKYFVVFVVIFVVAPILRAADVSLPDKIGGWTATGQSQIAKPDGAPQPILNESGYAGGQIRTYQSADKQAVLTLSRFHDSSGAYEAFTYLRANESPNSTVMAKGNLVLTISGPISAEDRKVFEAWTDAASDHVASPPIAEYLPTQGGSAAGARYALGPQSFRQAARELGHAESIALADEAGFESHAEAMLAKFKNAKDEATLLLIEYPTPQLAELHLRHLQRALADAKLTTSSIERKGSLLSIVLGPSSAEYAEKLRGSVNYDTSVTWNEPSSTATDPPIMSTLVKIIIATFVFMGVTLVLGIAFGGVRVITKRLFPGKVFDRKEQIEVLQLGLSGKPIDPTDLY